MSRYVIDENIILNAITGEKPDCSVTLTEKIFILCFLRGNDHLYINNKIKAKILKNIPEKISSFTKPLDNQIYPLIKKLIFDSSRTTIVDGIKNNFKGVKDCDTEFVGVAIHSNAILVTADSKLKNAIEKDLFASKCNCKTAEELVGGTNS
jgi:predicted nucleic acid-binding protein